MTATVAAIDLGTNGGYGLYWQNHRTRVGLDNANEFGAVNPTVRLLPTDVGFVSSRCGMASGSLSPVRRTPGNPAFSMR